MEKNKLLLAPFFVGIVLMVYSWYLNFPLSLSSTSDSIFNHISILYWISVPILLTSMFLIALSFKNKYWTWMMAAGIVIVLYSLSYFYYTLSTADASFFRGLIQNFIRTNDLNASQPIRSYYQWPSFFLLASITTSISGLSLSSYEFLLFTIIGFLLSSALLVYASKVFRYGAFAAVACFFVVMFSFFNFQAVPFTLAFSLLFILLMLQNRESSAGTTLIIIILYTSTVITHAFVALFFLIYLLIQGIVNKSSKKFEFFILSLVIYITAQITLAFFSFRSMITSVFTGPSEYSSVAGATLATTSMDADVIPHFFSRWITIAFAILCVVGFFLIILKRKLRKLDLAIFITGLVYSGLGVVLSLLGTRAIPLLFVPIVLGAAYLLENRFRKYFIFVIVVLLIFIVFVPMHYSFSSYPITYQTREDVVTSNFMLDKYDWNSKSTVISDSYRGWYMLPQIHGNAELYTTDQLLFPLLRITLYDSIMYSVGLEERLNASNLFVNATSQQIVDKFDIVYNSGFSYIAIKMGK